MAEAKFLGLGAPDPGAQLQRGINIASQLQQNRLAQERFAFQKEETQKEREERIRLQGAQLFQRQQGIDLQREQLAANIQQGRQEQLFKEQQAALEQEHRESQARVSNRLAVINSLSNIESVSDSTLSGLLQEMVVDLDGVGFEGVDFSVVDPKKAGAAINKVWADIQSGKLTKAQGEIAMQQVAAEFPKSKAAVSAAASVADIARGAEATARTQIAAGDTAGKARMTTLNNLLKTFTNRLNETNVDEELVLQGAARARLQAKVDKIQDEMFFAEFPDERPAPTVTPSPVPIVEGKIEETNLRGRLEALGSSGDLTPESFLNTIQTTPDVTPEMIVNAYRTALEQRTEAPKKQIVTGSFEREKGKRQLKESAKQSVPKSIGLFGTVKEGRTLTRKEVKSLLKTDVFDKLLKKGFDSLTEEEKAEIQRKMREK
jgi:hypothetical protein